MVIVAVICLILGLLFFTGGSVGIIRFPDFYSRLHPAGKLDTMGVLMSMTGMACYALDHFALDTLLTSVKIMLIVVFIFITSPTATHAIMDAGARAGLQPWTKDHKEDAA
jgi:multicomponent Na+:H+ antiporter subunit G